MAQTQDVFRALVLIEDTGSLAECSAIRHEGKLWLVPLWLDNREEQTTVPERIVCLDGLPVQMGGKLGDRTFDLIVNHPVPTSVLSGPIQSIPKGRFVVVDRPQIKFRRATAH